MRSFVLTVLVAGLTACAPAALDGDSGHTATWATNASAVSVLSHVYDPLAFADGHRTFTDPACPMTTDDGTTAHVMGACTDSAGEPWTGSATVVRGAGGERTVTVDAFGHGMGAAQYTGTVHVRPTSATQSSFDADLHTVTGLTTTISYTGTVDGTYDAPTVWNGTGTISREGFAAPTGTVMATTTDERMDSTICSGEPLSGSTTITSGGHTVVVTYDGATDCSAAHSARWTYDGVDQGAVSGINCSAIPGRAAPLGPAATVLVLGGVALLRRKRR